MKSEVDLEDVKEFYRSTYINNDSAVKEVEQIQKHLLRISSLPMNLRIRYIRSAWGYDKYLSNRAGGNEALLGSWTELLDWLQEDVMKTTCVKEWKEKIVQYERKHRRNEASEHAPQKGVQLLTMHASKGLEFEHCYIINVNEGAIPKYRKGEKLSSEQMEEERRIFYVGMTRAKKTLELHYLTGTKERPKLPSRFIRKLLR